MKLPLRLLCLFAAPAALASAPMPFAQQNELVGKYCAVCHSDAAPAGGLSLQHFDAARVPPSLAAMMLSKLTSGTPLGTVRAAASDPAAAALVSRMMRTGAMGASGLPRPDKATVDGLVNALAGESAGADGWSIDSTEPVFQASILREAAASAEAAGSYRFVVSCDPATRAGTMQLAWAPVAVNGTLLASVDRGTPLQLPLAGSEIRGNGSGVAPAVASAALRLPLPARSLRFSGLVPGEAVEFPWDTLPPAARTALAGCFAAGTAR